MQSNRFQAFSDSDNDFSDEDTTQNKSNRPIDPRSRAEKRQPKVEKVATKTETTTKKTTEVKQSSKPLNEQKKAKGVSAEAHPQDKHSGSGLKTHDRKGGAGKGNWGTYKDEVQEKTENVEGGEKTEEVVEEVVVEEEQLTLQEYMAQFGGAKTTTQKQTKGNQDYSEFKKEGCIVIEKTAEVDDKNPTKKKGINDKYIGMQNTDLLGFRTGIKTFALREEKPREFDNDRREQRKPREQKETVAKTEGEQSEAIEGKTEHVESEKRAYNRNNDNRGENRGRGGNRGGRGGRGGYQGDNRGNYNNKKAPQQKTSVKVNLEDDSLFPKLG